MTDTPRPIPVRPILPLWEALLVAVAGGFILDVAFPSLGVWPLAFVGIAAALVTLVGRTVWGGFLVGLVFGASFYFIHISWATRYLGVIPWAALAGSQALLWGVGSVLIVLAYRWMPRIVTRRAVAHGLVALLVAGLWTMRELFMGSWPYTGFPWGRMGMSQSESPVAHLASWLGVSGLTFAMVASVALLIELVRFVVRGHREGSLRVPAMSVVATPIVVLTLALFALPAYATTPNGTMTVGSVQGNGPAGAFDDRSQSSVFAHQLAATAPLYGKPMDVLVWPEGGVDWDPLREPVVAGMLDDLSDAVGAPVLMNAITKRGDDNFNTSMLWQAGSEPSQFYDKRYPVPFGEYVPDRWFYEMIVPDLIGMIKREYTRGTNSPVFDIGNTKAGLGICFDVVYDDVIWQGVTDGAEIYLLQTNNADFRETDENLQQLAFARMRAIETGRSVVNLSTVGTSQVIDPTGATIEELPEAEPGAMLTEVELRTGTTPAVIIGAGVQQVLFWGSLVALIACGVLARLQRTSD